MADVVSPSKKIALLHRHSKDRIKETNAAFDYLAAKEIDILTFKDFDRVDPAKKFWKSFLWIFYAPFLVYGKGYDVIYCDDSFPFYPAFVKIVSPTSRVILRLGDLHLMYYTKGWTYKFLHALEKIGWRRADKIIAISYPMAEYIYQEIGVKPEVVFDPVDVKDFPRNGSKNHRTVMFHGVLTRNKNIDILLEAASKLPKVSFVVIGEGPDKERLKGIAPFNVFFKGWVPFKSMCRYIETCAIGLSLRSDNPGNEFVVTSPFLQYGIMGKPCLVTRREVYEDYEWQFSGVDEMVEKIKILMGKPEEGEKLREYILKNHEAEKIAGQIWSQLSA